MESMRFSGAVLLASLLLCPGQARAGAAPRMVEFVNVMRGIDTGPAAALAQQACGAIQSFQQEKNFSLDQAIEAKQQALDKLALALPSGLDGQLTVEAISTALMKTRQAADKTRDSFQALEKFAALGLPISSQADRDRLKQALGDYDLVFSPEERGQLSQVSQQLDKGRQTLELHTDELSEHMTGAANALLTDKKDPGSPSSAEKRAIESLQDIVRAEPDRGQLREALQKAEELAKGRLTKSERQLLEESLIPHLRKATTRNIEKNYAVLPPWLLTRPAEATIAEKRRALILVAKTVAQNLKSMAANKSWPIQDATRRSLQGHAASLDTEASVQEQLPVHPWELNPAPHTETKRLLIQKMMQNMGKSGDPSEYALYMVNVKVDEFQESSEDPVREEEYPAADMNSDTPADPNSPIPGDSPPQPAESHMQPANEDEPMPMLVPRDLNRLNVELYEYTFEILRWAMRALMLDTSDAGTKNTAILKACLQALKKWRP